MTDSTLAARSAALDLIEFVLRRRQSLDESLEAHAGLRALPSRDRAFARLLTATLLRRLGQVDAVMTTFLDKPDSRPKPVIEDILRLGLVQILFLDTPPHAAVSTSVELVEQRGQAPMKGFVNALLRRATREGKELLAGQDAARLNTPNWMWNAWSMTYGEDAARRIAEVHMQEPPLDLSAKNASWAEQLEATVLPTGTLRRFAGGNVTELPGFTEGGWWVQDAAAALPVKLFGDLSGKTALDLCAAPGGKTCQLAAAGAKVTALDRSAKRLERVRENLGRLGLKAEIIAADAGSWTPPEPADAVLLDAPCSATGTARRHPDVLHLKKPADLPKLVEVQKRLLAAAVNMVKPGGLLIYCVCSLQPEEGEAVVESLLSSGAPVRRVPVSADEVGGLAELITPLGDVRVLPAHLAEQGGMDGFFVARLQRTGTA